MDEAAYKKPQLKGFAKWLSTLDLNLSVCHNVIMSNIAELCLITYSQFYFESLQAILHISRIIKHIGKSTAKEKASEEVLSGNC